MSVTALEAWIDITVVEAGVRVAPLRSLRCGTRLPDVTMRREIPEADVNVFHEVAAQHRFRSGCLTKALALVRFLRRRRIAAVLCLGLGGRNVASGHAWVEVDGCPVGESEAVADVYGRLVGPGAGRSDS